LNRTIGTGQPDRTVENVPTVQERTGCIGQPEFDSTDRTAGTAQPGQDISGGETSTWTGQRGQDRHNMTARTEQLGHDIRDRIARTIQPR
jgi:hypothetical protein